MCGYILTYSRIERENKGTLTSVSAVFHYRDNRQILTHNIRGQKEDFRLSFITTCINNSTTAGRTFLRMVVDVCLSVCCD